jgi:hypothetical protein
MFSTKKMKNATPEFGKIEIGGDVCFDVPPNFVSADPPPPRQWGDFWIRLQRKLIARLVVRSR